MTQHRKWFCKPSLKYSFLLIEDNFPWENLRIVSESLPVLSFSRKVLMQMTQKKIEVQKSSPKSHSGVLDCYREWFILWQFTGFLMMPELPFLAQNKIVPFHDVCLFFTWTMYRVGIPTHFGAEWADLGSIPLPAHDWSWNPDRKPSAFLTARGTWWKGVWRLLQNVPLTVSKRHREKETFSSSVPGFLNLSTIDIWGHLLWGLSCIWRTFSSNTGLYPLDEIGRASCRERG